MQKQNVDFNFHYAGGIWEVSAEFSRFSSTPSADYDDEWSMDNISVTGVDGSECYLDLDEVYIRKRESTRMISLADLIEKESYQELDNDQ